MLYSLYINGEYFTHYIVKYDYSLIKIHALLSAQLCEINISFNVSLPRSYNLRKFVLRFADGTRICFCEIQYIP